MRLFIAIDFDEKMKSRLGRAITDLARFSETGSFTRWENLHLTLHFIGETTRVKELVKALDAAETPAFVLRAQGLGSFRRQGGDIYWVGIEESPELQSLYAELSDALEKSGFPVSKDRFRPHITLGRRVSLKENFDPREFGKNIGQMETKIKRVSLMKSERIRGKLIYTVVHGKDLK